jgi:Putative peptidoglycan binding domain
MKNHFILRASWRRRSLLAVAVFIGATHLVSAEDPCVDSRIASVQQSLKLKHFYYGEVDGSFDYATQGALRRFQFRNGLPGTGVIDDATLEALTGISSPSKVATANIAARAERGSGAQTQKKENGSDWKASAANAEQERNLSASIISSGRLTVPHAAYTTQLPSWSAQHRAIPEDGIEVRRAMPVATADTLNGSESSAEVVTTGPAYFTGQDGHVYTYHKKIRTKASEVLVAPASIYGAGGRSFSFSREISDTAQIPGGAVANR